MDTVERVVLLPVGPLAGLMNKTFYAFNKARGIIRRRRSQNVRV